MHRLTLLMILAFLTLIGIGDFLSAESQTTKPTFPGKLGDWHGFPKYEFLIGEKQVTVVAPEQEAPGRPWVWHGEFFGHKPAPDIELLKRGFHLVYLSIPNMLGSPPAVEYWNECYVHLRKEYDFAAKVALVGLSRGGLYCYNWAIANPDKVACIYGDAPVCDFKSWPGGFGTGPGSKPNWELVLKLWDFENDEEAKAYSGNPVDNLKPLAEAGIPLLHVFGDADEVVPWEENTGLIAKRYKELGGKIELIRKPGVKHHPHGLDDPTPIVEFIAKHALPPPAKQTFSQDGIEAWEIDSPHQAGKTRLSIIRPEFTINGKRYPILFLLPVEAGAGSRWGNPLSEAIKHDLVHKHQVIIVSPTFSDLPWYANHPTTPQLQQEKYFVEDILKTLRWHLPEGMHHRDGRYLIGFSKSGWGAWSLLLRHQDLFAKAAAWDAPLMMDWPSKYGSQPIFGNEQNFRDYQLTRLLKELKSKDQFNDRLLHAGYDNFREHHQQMQKLLNNLSIEATYLNGPQRDHHWNSGWLPEVVAVLLKENGSDSAN